MRIKLVPTAFFAGLALGLCALAWLGATVQSRHLVENFVRFHRLINVEASYFPTARQALAVARLPAQTASKIHVIIGGTSVFHGVGQHASMVWTRVLQDLLGPQFHVVNLAQRAGRIDDFGNLIAEQLLREGRQVIYVSDGPASGPVEQSFYRHIMLDAWTRGYLLPWPPRDDVLSAAKQHESAPLRAVAWGALLDRYLNFNDFWNFISYEFAGTTWSPVLRAESFRPRRSLADPELLPEHYASLRSSHALDVEMQIVRGYVLGPENPRWRSIVTRVEGAVPPQLRSVTLAVIDMQGSYYVRRLSAEERATLFAGADEHTRLLRQVGFRRATVVGEDFVDDDFIDRIHLSVEGGRKVAAELAPIIRNMAAELGYLK